MSQVKLKPSFNVDNKDKVDILNITSRTWTTARLSHPRIYISAVTVLDTVMFAGGFDGIYPSSRIDIYNITSDSWSTAETSQARDSITSTVINDLVLFAGFSTIIIRFFDTLGGVREFVGEASDRVDILNTTSMTWSTASMSSSRTVAASVTVGHRVLIAGGNDQEF